MQHPGYITVGATLGVVPLLLLMPDGVMGCWTKTKWWSGWGWAADAVWMVVYTLAVKERVRREEALLKAEFGKEWERWHRRTKRFIPGVW